MGINTVFFPQQQGIFGFGLLLSKVLFAGFQANTGSNRHPSDYSASPPEQLPRFGFYNPDDSEDSPVVRTLLPGAENPFLSRQAEASTVFVIDKSGSMANGNLNRVVAALVEAIDLLTADQTFQVVFFFDDGPYYNPKLPDPSPATVANKRIVIDWMHMIQAAGLRPRRGDQMIRMRCCPIY